MSKLGEIFAVNIRELRKKHSITQKVMADKLGCTEKAVSKWERGMSIPDIETLLLVAKVFQVNVESLFHDAKAVYFLGISAGEENTSLILADSKCAIIRRVQTETINPAVIDMEKRKEILRNAIYKVCGDVDFSSVVLYAGISNITSDIQHIEFKEFFASFGFKYTYNDSSMNLYLSASLGDGDGIMLTVGTGASAHCIIDGMYTSIGGRGYLLSNSGGMYNIGRDGLNAYFSECDGIGEKTIITEMIRSDYGNEIKTVYEDIYYNGRHNIEKFAEYVFDAAENGDNVAKEIIKRNMSETVKFVEVLAKNFGDRKIPIVLLAIGMDKDCRLDYLKNEFKTPEKYDISFFNGDPTMGAVLLAKKEYEKMFPEEN